MACSDWSVFVHFLETGKKTVMRDTDETCLQRSRQIFVERNTHSGIHSLRRRQVCECLDRRLKGKKPVRR